MTSYLNSLTSHYTSLKRLLPNSLSADSDLHITDTSDSHVSRVLRAYYTEKGRPFPPWLGPDPNAPVPTKAAFVQQPYGNPNYGNPSAPVPSLRNSRGSSAGGLGDLFDTPGSAPPPKEEALSLRSRRRLAPSAPEQVASARPLPSQRVGSYQARGAASPEPSIAQPSREQSAQARLKARLGGARSNSPGAMSQRSGVSAQAAPSPDSYSGRGGGGYNAYDRGAGEGNPGNPYGSGGGNGGGSGNPYGSAPGNSYGGGGGGYGGGSKQPLTSANAPWASGDDGYGYGSGGGGVGGGYSGNSSGRGPGLPSNPRRR
ncbi:MAG: hypothetical protein MMC23_000273 [Stictis urceolatum]|nr:hypothetical protein [Stictis urceolata]